MSHPILLLFVPPHMQRIPSLTRDGLVLALLLAAMAVHASSFLPFISDDALIALRYAERLAGGRGLTWNDGEAVEGYSSLLWVLASALLQQLGVSALTTPRFLGVVGAITTVFAILVRGRGRRAGTWLSVAFLAASGPFAVWTVGGLETTLFSGLVVSGLVTYLEGSERPDREGARWLQASAAILAAASLARPEGPVFAAGILLHELRVGRSRRLVTLLGPTVLCVGAQLLFRMAYYHDVVPNSAHVKLALSVRHLAQGARYLGRAAFASGGLVVAAGWSVGRLFRRRRAHPAFEVVVAPMAVWSLYVLCIGGDILPAYRHVVPLMGLAILALVEALRDATPPATTQAILALSLVGFLLGQLTASDVVIVRRERWEWEGRRVARVLRAAFGDQNPTLAVDSAGCLPFFTGMPAIDMLGLNDAHIGSAPVPGFGSGQIGHERGDGRYVLDREPDLVLFCSPWGQERPCFRSGREMLVDPRFARDYTLVSIGSDSLAHRITAFVRVASRRIGVQRGDQTVVVPAYLLASGLHGAAARVAADGRIELPLSAGRDVPLPPALLGAIGDVVLPEGGVDDWTLSADARGRVRIRATRDIVLRSLTLSTAN